MNNLKLHTTGIDTPIKGLQIYLYDNIVANWSLINFDGYGRVYKNRKRGAVIPDYYEGEREYKEVLLSDKKDGIMFFSPSDTVNVYSNLVVQDCDIIFTFNLSKLGSNQYRQDEELRQRILFLLNNYVKQNKVKKIETGLNNVYRDYNGVQNYFKDMQEFHHFKVTLELRFINNNCI